MSQQPDIERDVLEAMSTFLGSPAFTDAGIDNHFVELFAKNMTKFHLLSPSTQKRIADQFSEQASHLSYMESIARKDGYESLKRLGEWFKMVNMLIVIETQGKGADSPK